MLIIGINGRPGSGKTTVSNILFKNDKTKVIHLDSIFNDIKYKFLKNNISILEQKDGTKNPYLTDETRLKKLLYLKQIKIFWRKIASIYVKEQIIKTIKDLKNKFDYLIIEGRALDEFKLENLCNIKFLLKAPIEVRRNRVLNRTLKGISENQLISIVNNDIEKNIDEKNYLIINNNGNYENLINKILQIKYLIKEFQKNKKNLKVFTKK